MARKGRESLQNGEGGVWRLSRKTGMGRQAIEEDRKRLGGSPGELGGVRNAGRGWEALAEGWEGSRVPPREPGGVWKSSQRTGRGVEALLESWEGSGGPPGGPGGVRKKMGGPLEGREV